MPVDAQWWWFGRACEIAEEDRVWMEDRRAIIKLREEMDKCTSEVLYN